MHYRIGTARDTHIEYLAANDVVAIGWKGLDLTHASDEEIRQHVAQWYSGSQLGKHCTQMRRFRDMQVGDDALVPLAYGVLLARIAGEEGSYVPEQGSQHRANQRTVDFYKDDDGEVVVIPRSALSEGLQRRLNVRGTYCQDLADFAEEIDGLFEGRTLESDDAEAEALALRQFSSDLLERLRDGSSRLRTGGRGLEELVRELFAVDGYRSRILSKREFAGHADADILAERDDILGSTKVYVQVKNHWGTSGGNGLQQLKKLRESAQVDDADRLVLLSTGTFPPDIEEQAAKSEVEVELIDGEGFVELLRQRLPELDRAWWQTLRISSVPKLL